MATDDDIQFRHSCCQHRVGIYTEVGQPDESVARLFQLPVVVNLVKVIVERDLLQVARVRAGDMILFGLNETEETEFDTVFLDSVVGSDAI